MVSIFSNFLNFNPCTFNKSLNLGHVYPTENIINQWQCSGLHLVTFGVVYFVLHLYWHMGLTSKFVIKKCELIDKWRTFNPIASGNYVVSLRLSLLLLLLLCCCFKRKICKFWCRYCYHYCLTLRGKGDGKCDKIHNSK